ncbi:hypothetical protein [Campylobacter phage CP39]|nr:hypothetical protein [Campylobacter phage CP39]
MEELLSKLDKNVFTPEVVDEIKGLFEAAVDNKVEAALKIADIHAIEVDKHYEKQVKMLKESAEMYKQQVNKDNQKVIHNAITKIKKDYNKLVEGIIKGKVDEFVKKGSMNLEMLVENSNKKAVDACTRTADKIHGPVNALKRINESVKKEKNVKKLEEKNKELQIKLEEAQKNNIYNNVKNKVSIGNRDMFDTLAESVAYTGAISYESNLRSIANKLELKSKNISRKSTGGKQQLSESQNNTTYGNFL